MADPPSDRCGFPWPAVTGVGDQPKQQSCCWRPTIDDDTDLCMWHADPESTDVKPIAALQKARPDPDVREQTKPYAELLDVARLTGCRIGDSISFSRIALRGADLAGTDLKRADLSHANLSRANLGIERLRVADMIGADSTDAKFKGAADLTGANLKGADLTSANLKGADLTDADLFKTNLTNADLFKADLTDADLYKANLTNTSLDKVNLTGADLIGSDLNHANLSEADLADTSLKNVDLTDTSLNRANLTNASLKGANLTDANLEGSNLTDANLEGSDLTDANLEEADLTDANLEGSDLTDANLKGANLTDASLNGACVNGNLERADLTRTDLFDANLRGAEFYAAVTTDTQINEGTTFGDHYVSDQGTVSPEDSQKVRWCARTIEQIAEDNALPDVARDAFLNRRQRKRSEAWREGDWGTWIPLTLSWLLMGYGESFKQVLTSTTVVIVTASLLYPLLGVKTTEAESNLTYPTPTPDAPIQFATELVDTLLTSGYFSVLTFTTLGFGDFRPVGLGRVIATVEAGFGVTLFALFVFVLGRRATR